MMAWGTDPVSGHAWTGFIAGGPSTSWVSPGMAFHGIVASNAFRGEYLGSILARSVTVGVTFAVAQATGAQLEPANILLRGTSISSYILARVNCNTDNSITLTAFSAAGALLGTVATTITHAGEGTPLRFEVRAVGHRIEARLWNPATTPRPDTPTAVFTDPSSVVAGWVGVRSGVATGNTNSKPVIFRYSNFEVLCEVTRFTGEVASWPPRRDLSGKVTTVAVDASGVPRRLGAGTKPLRSSGFREATKASSLSTVVAYWPAEDGTDAQLIAPGLRSHGPMSTHGEMTMASYTDFNGSDPLPVFGSTGRYKAPVPPYPHGATFLHALYHIPSGFPDLPALMHALCTGGSIYRILLWYNTASGGQLYLYVYDQAGTLLDQTAAMFSNLADDKVFISCELVQNGADVDMRALIWTFDAAGIKAPTAFVITDTYTGQTMGRVTEFEVGAGGENLTGLTVGHVMVAKNNSLISPLVNAISGRVYEKAGRRIERLLAEQGIAFSSRGDLDDTRLMGPQRSGKLLDLLSQCAEVDGGILMEEVDDLGMFYRTRRSLENQSPVLTLDYSMGLFASGFGAVPDDQFIRNDVVVSRHLGSSARVVLESGPLSVQSPPAGIGEGYQDSVELHNASDLLLPDQAGWRLHKGTIDDDRYPSMALRLESGRVRSNNTLAAGLLSMQPGDVVHDTNVPDSPDDVRLMVLGFGDTLTEATARLGFNAVPARAFDVGVRDDTTAGRRDTAGSQVASGLLLPGASGDTASTPDHASLDITGDIDIRAEVTADLIPPADMNLVSKYLSPTQRSWQFNMESNGQLRFRWSIDGSGISSVASASLSTLILPASGRLAFRVTLDVDDGAGNKVITFYTASSIAGPWTQLGSPFVNAGTTSIFASTASLDVGAIDAGTNFLFSGTVHAVEIRNGIDGTVVANPNFDAQTPGAASFVDPTGKTWTMNGAAQIVGGFAAGTATFFHVATTSPPLWTVDSGDVPLEIVVDGVRLTVTAIGAAAGMVQKFTITATPVNGVSKTIPIGKAVRLWRAAVRAL